jgi:2-methylcitrate dehydratase PrpD
MELNTEQIHGAIAQCVNLAAGNLEGGRSGGRSLREGGAVRNAFLAVALAKQGMRGGETVLEGEAGFYHSYAGNNAGQLSYVFAGPKQTSLDRIAEGLGQRWTFLETLYRIYSTAGFNIAHVDVTAALCTEHDIHPQDIDRIDAVVNWMETVYPSPAFPSAASDGVPRPGSTQYFSAYGAVERGFPLLKTGPGPDDPPAVLELMQRVTLVPSETQTLFGPKVTVYTKDGKQVTREGTGREFIWDFDEEVRRLSGIGPGLPIPEVQYAELTRACRQLDALPRAADLIRLTIPG